MQEFPPFRLDTVNQCLWRQQETTHDERILLTPKAFAVLQYLVEHAGRLITQEELLEAVWPETYVKPEVLKSRIFEVRSALGDRPRTPLFIETLPRRGYRFIATVHDGPGSEPTVAVQPAPGHLLGRDHALGVLRECLQRTLSKQRQIVFITGEPGIGKTTLVDAFRRQAASDVQGIRIACGQCLEGYGGKEAYYPMLEALGQLCRGVGGDTVVQTLAVHAPTWLVQFPALMTSEHRDTLQRELQGATRERMLREIAEMLEIFTAERPLLLVLEDLQWVDHATVDLLSALARRRTPAQLLLVATYRPVDLAFWEHPLKTLTQDLLLHQLCHEIAVKPLGEADVAAYLAAVASGASLPEGLTGLVYRHSEGNPLFMRAVLDHMTQQGLVSQEADGWYLRVPIEDIELGVPESLRQMIEAQIARLSPEEQRVLEIASLTGAGFTASVCAAAANLESEHFEALCETLSRRQHIVHTMGPRQFPDGSLSQHYAFDHALYREVCYWRQAPGRRARLHRHIGERLEALFAAQLSDMALELAHHFEAGADWTRAVIYLRLAADTAGRRYAHREVATLLQHALDLLSTLPEAERTVSEIEILEQLAAMYVGLFDMHAIEAYEALAARAARAGRRDVEIRALLGLAWPLARISSQRCLDVVERTLQLSAAQSDPHLRARTRMRCFFLRVWAGGWNPQDVDECGKALAEIRQADDRLVLALHLLDYSVLQWWSSAYRDAYQNTIESLALLVEADAETPYLSIAYWQSQIIMPWGLLLLGEWGEARREVDARITILEKNGDDRRAQAMRLYLAWVHLYAMDFPGVLAICASIFPAFGDPVVTSGLRICRVLAGMAETALGHHKRALEHLVAAREEMDRQTVLRDWYWRMPLESALTDLWLAQGDLTQARPQAERFLQVTLATAERTWQALAWDANTRVAMAEPHMERAHECIAKALSTMDGFEVPMAAWRVHATAAELYASTGNTALAEEYRERSRATIRKLANSLTDQEPLRTTFLSAPAVAKILGDDRMTMRRAGRT